MESVGFTHARPAIPTEPKPIENFELGESKFLSIEPPKTEKPLSLYSGLGVPYTVEYFDIETYEMIKNNPQLDADKIVDKVDFLERYILGEIKRKGFTDTTDSYREIIRGLKERLKINEQEKSVNVFLKIARYVRKYHWKTK